MVPTDARTRPSDLFAEVERNASPSAPLAARDGPASAALNVMRALKAAAHAWRVVGRDRHRHLHRRARRCLAAPGAAAAIQKSLDCQRVSACNAARGGARRPGIPLLRGPRRRRERGATYATMERFECIPGFLGGARFALTCRGQVRDQHSP